jgi:hypothetical protein
MWQAVGELLDAEYGQARSGQLDGQRNAVETLADPRDCSRVAPAYRERRRDQTRAVDEQLRRLRLEELCTRIHIRPREPIGVGKGE